MILMMCSKLDLDKVLPIFLVGEPLSKMSSRVEIMFPSMKSVLCALLETLYDHGHKMSWREGIR